MLPQCRVDFPLSAAVAPATSNENRWLLLDNVLDQVTSLLRGLLQDMQIAMCRLLLGSNSTTFLFTDSDLGLSLEGLGGASGISGVTPSFASWFCAFAFRLCSSRRAASAREGFALPPFSVPLPFNAPFFASFAAIRLGCDFAAMAFRWPSVVCLALRIGDLRGGLGLARRILRACLVAGLSLSDPSSMTLFAYATSA